MFSSSLQHALLSLRDIATWQYPSLLDQNHGKPPIIAALPSLQRGSVWKASQIELLWDSIFRGFPIGSLLISKKIEGQNSRAPKYLDEKKKAYWQEEDITHHLLDGQQRCNAITLGFIDPFSSDENHHEDMPILWIDLAPLSLANSTRQFLFRLTTVAHPWGYDSSDNAGIISVAQVRESLKSIGEDFTIDSYKRPKPHQLPPQFAKYPIPLAWLLQGHIDIKELANYIRERCNSIEKLWCKKIIDNLDSINFDEVEKGIGNALKTRIVPLEMPLDAIYNCSRQEEEEGKDRTNAEQLFNRINSKGTRLDGEELSYSLIKAYWPKIETRIDKLKIRPINASRIAILGMRAALTTGSAVPSLNIQTLRALAKNKEKEADQEKIHIYFNTYSAEKGTIDHAIEQIEDWLIYKECNIEDLGLPPYIRCSIAHSSQSLYLLLMLLAERIRDEKCLVGTGYDFRRSLLAMVTLIHWFCINPTAKENAIKEALSILTDAKSISKSTFEKIFENLKIHILSLPTAQEFKELLNNSLPVGISETDLQNWNWYSLPKGRIDDRESDPLRLSIDQIRHNKELLIYAQRKWMNQRFSEFDRANPGIWDDHDRPWDYDHLLPQAINKGKWNLKYKNVCNQWIHTIANLHVSPFEENRSRGALGEIPNRPALLLCESGELQHFKISSDSIKKDSMAVYGFITASKNRMIRIYEDWYSNLYHPTFLDNNTSNYT